MSCEVRDSKKRPLLLFIRLAAIEALALGAAGYGFVERVHKGVAANLAFPQFFVINVVFGKCISLFKPNPKKKQGC
ncbi:MAG: hypothetical protein ACI9CF_000684 [Candidatus Omnitrophota bacterium]|jgi:hypothetical protein